jgi:hypothetical protein
MPSAAAGRNATTGVSPRPATMETGRARPGQERVGDHLVVARVVGVRCAPPPRRRARHGGRDPGDRGIEVARLGAADPGPRFSRERPARTPPSITGNARGVRQEPAAGDNPPGGRRARPPGYDGVAPIVTRWTPARPSAGLARCAPTSPCAPGAGSCRPARSRGRRTTRADSTPGRPAAVADDRAGEEDSRCAHDRIVRHHGGGTTRRAQPAPPPSPARVAARGVVADRTTKPSARTGTIPAQRST